MRLNFLVTMILSVLAISVQAQTTTIPNELGAPQAGGLPREQSSAYQILYGSVRVGEEIQRVIVTKPPGNTPKPALLFVGGLDCYSLDFSGTGPKVEAYQRIIDFVTRLGFVTMRVEKTGMGDSIGTACENQDFHREVAGNYAGLKALRSYPFVDAKQLHIFGHSIGGVIAPLLASKVSIKSVTVLGTLASNWYQYDVSNTRRQYALSGMSPQQVEAAMIPANTFSWEFYINRKTPQQIVQQYPSLANYFQLAAHWTYMQQLSEVDPKLDWNRSQSSVLIISGDSDFVGSQANELSQMIYEANKTRATPLQLVTVEKLDHFFRTANSQRESFNSQNSDGSPLVFQESILEILSQELLR